MRMPVPILMIAFAACTDRVGQASFGDDLADPQRPARGASDTGAWLEQGFYQTWTCEAEPHAARPPSPHGTDRVCNNDLLHGSASGAYPVGSASVKEIFDDAGRISGHAVYIKVSDGVGADGWYWYEAFGGEVATANPGSDNCTSCHTRAPRDFVYTHVE